MKLNPGVNLVSIFIECKRFIGNIQLFQKRRKTSQEQDKFTENSASNHFN